MRQETIIKTYLTYDELTEDQKLKVLEKYYDINTDYEWYEHLTEYYQEKLQKLGFYKISFEFSGFYSQGDGASFKAKHKRGTIYKQGRYSHSNTMCCDESEVLLLVAKRIANKYYNDLKKEYDYLTSREAIEETIKANFLEFDLDTLN
jgi:hypothetical protein